MTQVIKAKDLKGDIIQKIYNSLRNGEVIAYPTDTIYGLGVDVFSQEGIERLSILKGRDVNKPFSVLYKSKGELLKDFDGVLNFYQKEFVEKLLPGKITLVLPVPENKKFPQELIKDGFIGVRVVNVSVVSELLRDFENPITTTSVNPAGKPPAKNLTEILKYFDKKLSFVIYTGYVRKPSVSTVIKVTESDFQILREGAVSIFEIINKIKK
ncbi:MAG: threonylcarbamoyl-AMP synthase [Candidatus Marinimicrobia bacterium]|nr:threonylcarbamoyl-AMP synthase [Candidatus Neomarinimicrobiota bacterium]